MTTQFHLYLRKDKQKKNGEHSIYLRITSNRRHVYLSTGVSVPEKFWNDQREEIRKGHSNCKALNQILKNKVRDAEKIYADLERDGDSSLRTIKERLTGAHKTNFFDLAKELLDEMDAAGRFYPHKNAKVAIDKLEKYEGSRFLPLRKMDSDYLDRFMQYLKVERKNSQTTISKNFEPIRKVIHRALKDKVIMVDPFLYFKGAKRKDVRQKIKLSLAQIKKIEELDLVTGSPKWHARNAFLFSFYSGGIRFGDICCLKWINVRDGRLAYKMNKNDKLFSTELNEFQKKILSKYSGEPEHFIFPFLNSHKDYTDPKYLRRQISSKNYIVNKNIDKIAQEVGLGKGISFHVSRHSFAQHAVETGLDVYDLMQTLRHTKLETTQKYLKSLDEGLADKAMSKVFGTLMYK